MRTFSLSTAVVAALCIQSLGAQSRGIQGGSPIDYALLELQDVLHKAMDKVAPSTVTVQTFGGTRMVEGPEWKPKSKKPPKPKPDTPKMPGEKPKKKPKTPLVAKGFKQSQGATTGIILSPDGEIIKKCGTTFVTFIRIL